jgi:hypothetical protein
MVVAQRNCHVGNGPGELLTAALDAKSSMAIKLYDAAQRPSPVAKSRR